MSFCKSALTIYFLIDKKFDSKIDQLDKKINQIDKKFDNKIDKLEQTIASIQKEIKDIHEDIITIYALETDSHKKIENII